MQERGSQKIRVELFDPSSKQDKKYLTTLLYPVLNTEVKVQLGRQRLPEHWGQDFHDEVEYLRYCLMCGREGIDDNDWDLDCIPFKTAAGETGVLTLIRQNR